MLHRVMREHLATFLARSEMGGGGVGASGLPRYVRKELEGVGSDYSAVRFRHLVYDDPATRR